MQPNDIEQLRTQATINGKDLAIRMLAPSDQTQALRFVQRLSFATKYFRFGHGDLQFSADEVAYQCNLDQQDCHHFIVVEVQDGDEIQVASALFCPQTPERSCEFSIVVSDAWQRTGLAHWLMSVLIESARIYGFRQMVGQVLATNHRMLKFAQRHGFTVTPDTEHAPIKVLTLQLMEPDRTDSSNMSPMLRLTVDE